ncbi:MAG: substrate-binding domain-containing protein [Qipengyuania pacifica]
MPELVRVGVAEGLACMPLGDMLRSAATSHPELRIQMIERPLSDMLRMLTLGALDVIFAPEQAATSDSSSILAWEEPLAVILPLACGDEGKPIRCAAIDLPIVLPDPDCLPGLDRQISSLLTPQQVRSSSASRFSSLAMIYAMVASGHCAGLLPRSLAVASDWNVMRLIQDTNAKVTVWLTQRRGEETGAAALIKALL